MIIIATYLKTYLPCRVSKIYISLTCSFFSYIFYTYATSLTHPLIFPQEPPV